MIGSPMNAAVRRYTYRFTVLMLFYVVFLVAAVWTFSRHDPAGLPAYSLALLPASPIVAMLVVVGLYLAEESDEFLRNLFVQSMVWGIGATLTVTTVRGFLELFVPVPHLQPYLVFPIFWAFVGVATCILRLRYR